MINTNKHGFSLTEVLMSLIIMAVVSLFLVFAIPNEFKVSHDTQAVAQAAGLAQKYIEQAKSELKDVSNYDAAVEGTVSPIDITSDLTGNGDFDVTVNVIFVGYTGRESYLKEINVVYRKSGSANDLVNMSIVLSRPEDAI